MGGGWYKVGKGGFKILLSMIYKSHHPKVRFKMISIANGHGVRLTQKNLYEYTITSLKVAPSGLNKRAIFVNETSFYGM